ncbi:MAG: GIY-YIG nuclease family protein [Gammaproteobacteria bacterium]
MERQFFVYILTSQQKGTLYIGMTSNLIQRVWQHKMKLVKGFTEKYDVCRLVYYECCGSAEAAIRRERQMKKWNRAWKIRLIEENNPYWRDLYTEIIG